MDESRFGLLTVQRRVLCAKGVKPIVPYQHRFENFYLFGAYEPQGGDHFTLELPYCNSQCFQLWMEEFSKHQPEVFKIIVLDNGAFHKSKDLVVPPNMALTFLPPYSPELNPAEMMWSWIKGRVANQAFETIQKVADAVADIVRELTNDIVESITGWSMYKNAMKDLAG